MPSILLDAGIDPGMPPADNQFAEDVAFEDACSTGWAAAAGVVEATDSICSPVPPLRRDCESRVRVIVDVRAVKAPCNDSIEALQCWK
mmetsp:Transcript_57526/g.108410  ORF Transcript_57526/g.108410 Transcript_57526/m.108410 type:complete len:88 (-) Transcript_57526:1741-2004(-)